MKVIRQYGDGAADFAAARIYDFEGEDDLGRVTWGLILLKITELQRVDPSENECVH